VVTGDGRGPGTRLVHPPEGNLAVPVAGRHPRPRGALHLLVAGTSLHRDSRAIDPAPYLHVTGGRRIHHLGYYTEDLPGAAHWLEDHGYRRELNGVDHDGNVARATFHYNPESPGMWIELVSHEVATEVGTELARAAAELGIDFRSPFS